MNLRDLGVSESNRQKPLPRWNFLPRRHDVTDVDVHRIGFLGWRLLASLAGERNAERERDGAGCDVLL
jgi:hypothetical protein